jgi:hypothetical protein
MNRNIFAALAELATLMPPEQHVTRKDIINFCRSRAGASLANWPRRWWMKS